MQPSTPSQAETKAGATAAPKKSARAKAAKRVAPKLNPLKIPNSKFEALAWHEIAGWMDDDHGEAFSAFLASCKPILRSSVKARSERGETYRALVSVCERAAAAVPLDEQGARFFFEQNFRPIRLTASDETEGFFTGYYEPVVEGSRFPSDIYTVPLYRRPSNLVTQRLRRSTSKGKAGKRLVKRSTAPYYDRTQIEEGALAGRDLEICYLKDPIDAFFADIQGSVRVRLEDGKVLRLNYADKNGHPYFAVGSVLIQRGIVSKEEMSMQKIREFMEKNPEEGKALRRMNKSYVFFRETDLGEHDEAIGAQGISLTAARSSAVDRKIHTYGMPVFVNALLPIVTDKPDTWFRRLMIAQDTGGAIIGPARADIYLGAGDEAARAAGRFKHNCQFVMLIPNELDPDDEALGMPLPKPRPKEEKSWFAIFSRPQANPEDKAEDKAVTAPVAPPVAAPAAPAASVTPAAAAPAATKGDPKVKPQSAARTDPKSEARPQAPPKANAAAKPDPVPVRSVAKPAPKSQAATAPDPKQQSAPKPQPAAAATAAQPKSDPASKARPTMRNGNPFPKPVSFTSPLKPVAGKDGAPAAKSAPKPAPKTTDKPAS